MQLFFCFFEFITYSKRNENALVARQLPQSTQQLSHLIFRVSMCVPGQACHEPWQQSR